MRNLQCIHYSKHKNQPGLPLTAAAWDTITDSIVCAYGPSKADQVIDLKRIECYKRGSSTEAHLIASWDAPCPLPNLDHDRIIDLHYLVQLEASCLVLAGGDIVVVRSQPLPGQEKIEIVGSIDAGITAARWSPDEELLAVTTGAHTLLFMTLEFENIANVPFSADDSKLSKHVSVGWGKSETQFKGKRAKALRDPTIPERVDEGTVSTHDLKDSNISWRGDGEFLATNTFDEEQRRMIRVYSREGILDSVSEPVDGLEGALSWRPAGNLLAGIQRLDDRIDVVFFERNGLRHGEFSLRVAKQDMDSWASSISLSWNIDSTVLAVSYCDRVQLWTMGNYHYYLKQEFSFPLDGEMSRPLTGLWHPEESLRVAALQAVKIDGMMSNGNFSTPDSGAVHEIEVISNISSGCSLPPDGFGMTLVQDGSTALRIANIPPPFAQFEIQLPEIARDSAANKNGSKIAVLGLSSVFLYRLRIDSKSARCLELEESFELPTPIQGVPLQICFSDNESLHVLFSPRTENARAPTLYDVYTGTFRLIDTEARMTRFFPSADYRSLVCSMDNSTHIIASGSNNASIASTAPICSFPSAAPYTAVVSYGGEHIAIGLTSTGSLYANTRVLLRNCSSFFVTDSHLILTTTNHLLKFVHLSRAEEDLAVPPDQPEADERCRNIERGARLVAVIPTTSSVILQMPRGNTETIHPRALVLASIRRSVENKQYRAAFLNCRSNRVDMNILYDYLPDQFLESVSLVLDQLKSVEYIDLLLSQFRGEDVSKTMYKETLPSKDIFKSNQGGAENQNRNVPVSTSHSKVNRICDAFLSILVHRYSTNLQNVITAHLCKSPPDIESGLHVISDLQAKGEHDFVETAVEHTCFLADVNKIYDAALGMYNLQLALLVAQQSQKDPREYLPYLQDLQEQPELRRKYLIDHDLKRYESALAHLHAVGDFDEVKAYTERHELYKSSLELYKYNSDSYAAILQAYAEFLSSRSRYKEAAIAFESLSDYTSASEAYRASNSWRESLSCAKLASQSPESVTSLAKALAESLEEAKEYSAAATVQLEYLSDVEAATEILCKGHHFSEAIRIVSLHGLQNLLKDVVDPGLGEGFATLTELLADCKGQLKAQVPRLKELREIKARDPLAFFGDAANHGGANDGADIPDDMSLAASSTASTNATTLVTRYTNRHSNATLGTNTSRRSSKKRRAEERKRAKGKKGSVYEEEYLVASIGRLVERVNGLVEYQAKSGIGIDQSGGAEANADGETGLEPPSAPTAPGGELAAVTEVLLRRGMREQARVLERSTSEVLDMCRECIREVFEVKQKQESSAASEIQQKQGSAGLDIEGQAGVPWWRKLDPPVVPKYEGVGLL
ncbi:MAG: hypothetical protein M1831_003265 [Alyxoria varia]|nr:MAG: hypothetical protein M1831_003265 [Alyxoria varia]